MTASLKDRLEEAQVEWPQGTGSFFLPADQLESLISVAEIKAELEKFCPTLTTSEPLRLSQQIDTTSKKLFALLLCDEKKPNLVVHLPNLLDENVTDKDLPFVRIENARTSSSSQTLKVGRGSHANCNGGSRCSCTINTLQEVRDYHIIHLCRNQWRLLAPIFERGIPNLELDENCPLPFIDDREKESKMAGGYSEVWGVKIHTAHQKLLSIDGPEKPWFAVKRLFNTEEDFFQNERQMLSELTKVGHTHLVKLHATWKRDRKYHMLFQLADSNLWEFWKTHAPQKDRETWLWAVTQMKGLASGLETIHNFPIKSPLKVRTMVNPAITSRRPKMPGELREKEGEEWFGRHGDLKPENILIFQDGRKPGQLGTLQISDFGLARFHRQESRSLVSPHVAFSATYVPPEIYLEEWVSRKYDIWSMGCVYLQFVTWLLEGPAGLEQFADKRMEINDVDGVEEDVFFTQLLSENNVKGAQIKQGVREWIKYLRQSPACSDVILDLLDLIEAHMLLISTKNRIQAIDLDRHLGRILDRAKTSNWYLLR